MVVDPRKTDTCELADLHLCLRPGTDVMLFNGLLHLMVQEGWIRHDYIRAHTQGFDAVLARVAEASPDRVAQVCGLRAEDLRTAARWFATSAATLSLYCMGLNQSSHGTAKNAALINLHLATAQIGKPGAGPFSLTGQPNAMGGREVGGLSNLLPAHRDMANPAHRAEVAALWGVPDVPATTWGEKEGTVTNSERRISRVRAAVAASGQAQNDWVIGVAFARCLAHRLGRGEDLFPYECAQDVWEEHRASTRGRDLDITGMSYAMLEAAPQQWPLPEGQTQGRARLYEDGVFATADGRAQFVDTPFEPLAEPCDIRYPLSLNTGRLRDQWHGMSRSGTLGQLFGHAPEPVVQMPPDDMAERGLQDGDLVHVTSRHGSLVIPVAAADELARSRTFIAMHWDAEFLGGRTSSGNVIAGVNALTTPAHCPVSKQPELKHVPVRILKAELPWTLLAMA